MPDYDPAALKIKEDYKAKKIDRQTAIKMLTERFPNRFR
jgi:hypothetical protein